MTATLAIPYENGRIAPHFGHAAQFKIYTIADDALVSAEVEKLEDVVGHDAIGLWLVVRGVNAVICDKIGPNAQGVLRAAGIQALAGVQGDADDAVRRLIAGALDAVNTATCGCHGTCGEHGTCGGGCHCHGHGGGACG